MIKDKWIYQNNLKASVPWALYVIKEYEPGSSFDDVVLDITFYSEQIDNSEHMLAFLNWQYPTLQSYVSQISNQIDKFGGLFDCNDADMVEHELCKLFFD